jgi:aminoglycoside phosphotransferase (APT) family kinase protein
VTGPGPLIASGRDADIFAYGDAGRLVLRRSRAGRSMAGEAKVMDYVRGQGYPVPAVDHLSDDGTDLIMERIDGPSMVEFLGRKPWLLRTHGRVLGDLHRRLHQIPGPDWLDPVQVPGGAGESLVHLDLHPLNVIVGPSGPVVIDWTNARRGAGAVDVAINWVLMSAGEIPGNRLKATVMGRARGLLINAFLAGFDLGPVRSVLRAVVAWKVTDPHMSEGEQRRMWAVVAQEEKPSGPEGAVGEPD